MPLLSVPTGDTSRRHTTGQGKVTTRIDISAVGRDGVDAVIHTIAQCRPSVSVPMGDMVGTDAGHVCEIPTEIDITTIHTHGIDGASGPLRTTQGGPEFVAGQGLCR